MDKRIWEVDTFHDIDDMARQVRFRKPFPHRRWPQVVGVSIHSTFYRVLRAENQWQHAVPSIAHKSASSRMRFVQRLPIAQPDFDTPK